MWRGTSRAVENWIADFAAEMRAAQLMTLHAAWVMDTQGVAAVRRDILRGREPARDGVPTDHIPTRREAARERFAWLLEAVTSKH